MNKLLGLLANTNEEICMSKSLIKWDWAGSSDGVSLIGRPHKEKFCKINLLVKVTYV